jgi:type II secretory pathway pseudopilin PulG
MRISVVVGIGLMLTMLGAVQALQTARALDATMAAGERLVIAIEEFRVQNGRYPLRLSEIGSKADVALHQPPYGHAWSFGTTYEDTRYGVTLAASDPVDPPKAWILSVALSGRPGDELVRDSDGCWRLPGYLKCWKPTQQDRKP